MALGTACTESGRAPFNIVYSCLSATGATPAVSLAIPERGLVRKDRLGGAVAELHYLCESPGR
jgi:hypothetical protein